jgi:transmembrane sensor
MLQPGERLAIDQRTPQGSPVPLRADETRWPTGMLSFEDTPLAEVVAAANRYSIAPIALADPALGELRFTGTLSARDMPGTADTLAATFHLEPVRGDRGSIVLSPRR